MMGNQLGVCTTIEPCPMGEMNRFAKDAELEVAFTLNAGKGPRDSKGHWKTENAYDLIGYSVEKGCKVAAWSLGNELRER